MGENRRLRAEVERLAASREKLREENQRLADENRVLERRLTVGQLVAGLNPQASSEMDRHGVKIARARVSRLIREVDRCAALLNRDSNG
jgi:regulator of replication initiation timing